MFDTEEVVVKPVASILRHIPMFSGNTILGDGSVIMILDPNGIARAVGLSTAAPAQLATGAADVAEQSGASTAMLLFRPISGGPPCAVPLGLVARIEDIPREMIEQSSGRLVTQYRGQLMPLLRMDLAALNAGTQPVLVFSDRGRSMGLMVAEIVDVVDARLTIELAASLPGMLGSAVIAGRATEVLDAGHWMTQAWEDWFCDTVRGTAHVSRPRLLVVEDSAFFRQLLVPALSAAGYHVVAVESAAKALALQAGGPQIAAFDAIVSDIEMPDMDGLAFAQLLRSGGPWANLPLIALSGRATILRPRENPKTSHPWNAADVRVDSQADFRVFTWTEYIEDIARGRAAGFTDYVAKFKREPLLASLQSCLAPRVGLLLAA